VLKLLIQDDEGRKTLVPFSRDEITIGREDGNTIRLTERNVSRHHARLFRHSAQIFIEDLKSHNGVQINGRRIVGQSVVRKGDTIGIGDYDIVLEGNFPAPPPHPPKNQDTAEEDWPVSFLQNHASQENTPPPELLPDTPAFAPPPITSEEQAYEIPSSPVEFPASVAHVDTFDLKPQTSREFATSVTSRDTLDLVGERPTLDLSAQAPREFAASVSSRDTLDLSAQAPREFASSVTSRDTLDLADERPPGERPTIRLPEFMELPDAESPRLVALNLTLRGREFLCSRSEFSLGQSSINDLVLKHPSVAPLHCRMERDEQGHWFLAVDPRYPVLVNGEPYQQFALENGDILTLGEQELQFFLPDAQQAPAHAPSPSRPRLRPTKASPSKFLPFGIGALLALLVVVVSLYFYWSTGALHEAPFESIRSLAQRFLPPPPSARPPAHKPPSEKQKNTVQASSLLSNPPAETPTEPALESADKLENIQLGVVLQPSQKPAEAQAPSEMDKVLSDKTQDKTSDKTSDKTAAGRPSSKTTTAAIAPPPIRPGKTPRETRDVKAGLATSVFEPAELEATTSPMNDADLFWEDVYLLQKKAEREFTAASKRVVLSGLHDKLSTCETARCAYELAKTSLLLSKLGSSYAKTRYLEEFEAYLSMKDTGKQSRARKEDACNTLLSYYNSSETAAAAKTKVQALSEICTR